MPARVLERLVGATPSSATHDRMRANPPESSVNVRRIASWIVSLSWMCVGAVVGELLEDLDEQSVLRAVVAVDQPVVDARTRRDLAQRHLARAVLRHQLGRGAEDGGLGVVGAVLDVLVDPRRAARGWAARPVGFGPWETRVGTRLSLSQRRQPTPHMAATWRASVPQQPPTSARFGRRGRNAS